MNDIPEQRKIDAVAHFVEAVRELQLSPFFVEEFQSLSISMKDGDPKENIKAKFPDPNILKGMLVPFRRAWNQNEPCHHAEVINILKQYNPKLRGLLDSFSINGSRAVMQHYPWFKDQPLSLSDVINIWINTKYHHVGKSQRYGKFTRKDFDRFSTNIGPILFEFCFLSALQEVGCALFNIQIYAEAFLQQFAEKGLKL